ncbi:MAG: DUF3237 domain-containing protein, partial [Euryarchaeota archaeon]|nr:DUF3237 domain-containing protein [Euryarchaeota archaeon]
MHADPAKREILWQRTRSPYLQDMFQDTRGTIDKRDRQAMMKMAKYEMKTGTTVRGCWLPNGTNPNRAQQFRGKVRLNGKFRPFGADWGLIRGDNCLELDVRGVIETDNGALIHT